MKIKQIFFTEAALLCVVPNVTYAACQTFDSCTQCTTHPNSITGTKNCSSYNSINQGFTESNTNRAVYLIYDCTQCKSGYVLTASTLALSPTCTIGIHTCETDPCAGGCTDCSSTSWAALRTGYQSRTVASCSCKTCTKTTQYQCAAGYYGASTNGTSGCTQCPTWTGVYTTSAKTTLVRGTSAAGATAITGCYVTEGTYYDTTGTIKTTGNCAYKSS